MVASKPKPKPFTATMKRKLKDAAKKLGLAAPDVAKGDGKGYEAWAFFEIASRLALYIDVTPRDHQGAITKNFRLRGGPGHMPSYYDPPGEPCYFLLYGSADVAELHNSLRHKGRSSGDHELDISVIDHAFANQVRLDGGGLIHDLSPELGTLLGIELKEYGSGTSLPKGYARALLGVSTDLDHGGWLQLGAGRKFVGYQPPLIDFFLLTTAELNTSQALTDHWDLNGRSDVRPGNEGALDEIVARLLKRLGK
jgi:hypothetical protein